MNNVLLAFGLTLFAGMATGIGSPKAAELAAVMT